MQDRNWGVVLSLIFIALTLAFLLLNRYYKEQQYTINSSKIYHKLSSTLIKKLQTLIEEKKNATLTISLAFAQKEELKSAIKHNSSIQQLLHSFSLQLRKETDFKNVWFQLVDPNGRVISRSWSAKRGDNIFEVRSFFDVSKVSTIINVDKYDLSFKALVPLYDNEKLIGFLETITHFNSIAKKIEKEGFYPVVVVDKAYSNHLKYPFSKHFIDGYYIANKNVHSKVIEHIQKHKGIKHFLNYTDSYTLKNPNYLEVHHTLFDRTNDRSMAYILMFKNLDKVDTTSLKNIDFVINILTLFILVALAFVLILFYAHHRRPIDQEINAKKYILIFVSIFLIVALSFYFVLKLNYENEKSTFFKNHNIAIKKDFDVILNKYKTVANTMFETVINSKNVKTIIQQAYGDNKEMARKRLYSTLIDHYRFFQTYDLRQLHFHLKDNESFLRFHRPGKYGDNLTGIRSTVEWVNENHSALSGFEEGRIYNGFRYVFPLETHSHSYQEHLGSVETSFSAHAIAREFARSHNAKTGFFIHREVVDEKVFKSEHANYIESPMASFYYEKAIKKQLEYEFKHINIDKLDTQSLQLANQKIFEGKLFTLASSDEKMFFTFLPLHNPVTNKIVAALILQVENDRLSRFKYNYIIMLTIGWVLILLTTIFVYREYLTKVLFQNLLRRTQRILDTQKSIIVITNGESIFDVNQTFLDFFGYETLSDFKKRYRCICDRFIQHENYFHLGKVSANRSWVEELHHIPDKDKVVLVQDKEGIEYSMALSFNYYKDEHFVVTFNDISGTIQEQIMLQKKVLIDSLTGAYNREFFASNIDSIIDDTSKRGRAVGILFFDIDHFKNINDTYGHDIGDKVLKELVARVSDSIRESDYLIRWGGEEFIVLIAIRSLKGATRVAEHLRSMIENHSFEEVKSITCSFGVTVLHHDHENIEEAIKRADQALYRSKESGRNRITMDRV